MTHLFFAWPGCELSAHAGGHRALVLLPHGKICSQLVWATDGNSRASVLVGPYRKFMCGVPMSEGVSARRVVS